MYCPGYRYYPIALFFYFYKGETLLIHSRNKSKTRGRIMPKIRITLVTLLLCSIIRVSHSEDVKKDFHESFPAEQGGKIHLEHGDGDVTIRPWSEPIIDVHVRYEISESGFRLGGERDFDVEFKQRGKDLYIVGREKHASGLVLISSTHRIYTYEIHAPEWVILELQGDDGEISIEGWQGEISLHVDDGRVDLRDIENESIEIRTQDGDVMVRDCRSRLQIYGDDADVELVDVRVDARIRLQDGDIMVRDVEGPFNIQTDDGDCILDRLKSKEVSVRTSDGDIDLSIREEQSPDIYITTDDGSVRLGLPKELSANINVNTDDGRITVAMPGLDVRDEQRNAFSADMRDGKGRIRINTSDGDVSIYEER
ncbi:DUF4097 family beta strand repeat protein [candidate division KSB1 bacterium]|nr:DUF4097 family beta strand repeat protein [candidate division KSB1 bacterium]